MTNMFFLNFISDYMGTTFYLAAMPAYNSQRDLLPVQLKIVSNEAGTVRVILPALQINRTYLLTPKVTNISITGSEVIADAIGIDNKGIQILSTVEVAVHVIEGHAYAGSGKVMSLMPVIDSAKVFVVQSYETDWNIRKSHFVIIATEDLTDVDIKLKTASLGNVTYNNMIYKDGDIISITLNRLQTFYVYIFANDLSGSLIESNKPIAVFSGTDCVDIPRRGGGCNIIESQMIPVSQWGNVFVVPTIYPGRCHVRVFAFHNTTRISVRAKFDLGRNITLNQGEFWETTLYGSQAQPLIISGDTVVSIVLYGASIGSSDEHKSNPFMLVVPDIHQYSTLATTFPTLLYGDSVTNERPYENYAAIVLLEDSFSQLQYNGHAPDVLQNYSLPNEFTVVITPLKNVTTHTISTVSMSTPMLVFVYGMARYESYGFVAGYTVINAGNKT